MKIQYFAPTDTLYIEFADRTVEETEGLNENMIVDRDVDGNLVALTVEQATRLRIDRESDALYFRLDETTIVELEEVQPGVILDFDKNNLVVGIEILDLSTRMTPDMLRVLQFETA